MGKDGLVVRIVVVTFCWSTGGKTLMEKAVHDDLACSVVTQSKCWGEMTRITGGAG